MSSCWKMQLWNQLYIITKVKHAIWLANSRAGSGYPAQGAYISAPWSCTRNWGFPLLRFRSACIVVIVVSLIFKMAYFLSWPVQELCSTFGKRKNTLACGSSIFTLSESLATSLGAWITQSCTENHSVFLYSKQVMMSYLMSGHYFSWRDIFEWKRHGNFLMMVGLQCFVQTPWVHYTENRNWYLSFIDLERGGFGEILPEVMILPEGALPQGKYHNWG
jgi:hypothetical protein